MALICLNGFDVPKCLRRATNLSLLMQKKYFLVNKIPNAKPRLACSTLLMRMNEKKRQTVKNIPYLRSKLHTNHTLWGHYIANIGEFVSLLWLPGSTIGGSSHSTQPALDLNISLKSAEHYTVLDILKLF